MTSRLALLAALLMACVRPTHALAQALTITSVVPAPNAQAAPRTSAVTVTFTQPLTGGADALQVYSAQRGGRRTRGPHLATVRENSLLFAAPDPPYLPGETVSVSVTKAATAGSSAVRPKVLQFTTAVGGAGRGDFRAGSQVPSEGEAQTTRLGDVDGDGDLDLITDTYGIVNNDYVGTVRVQLNGGDNSGSNTGTFSNGAVVATDHLRSKLAVGDVDGDGDLDILVSTATSSYVSGPGAGFIFTGQVTSYLNGGDNSGTNAGRFSKGSTVVIPDCSEPGDLALADVEGDGDLDVLVLRKSNVHGFLLAVRLNGGDASGSNTGTFSNGADDSIDINGGYPKALAVGDLDGDGDLDVVTLVPVGNRVYILLNGGDNSGSNTGRFSGVSTIDLGAASPQNVVLGDVDGDGDLDFLTANSLSYTISVYLNNGNASSASPGTFSRSQQLSFGGSVHDLALADVDADGDLDLLAGCVYISAVVVRLNGGDASGSNTGTFSNGSQVTVGNGLQTLTTGDLDGDGDLDLLAALDTGTLSVRLNSSGSALAARSAGAAGAASFSVVPTIAGDTPLRYTYAGSLATPSTLAIYALTGQRVWQQTAPVGATGLLPTAGLPSGWYVVRLLSANQSYTARFYQP